MPLFKKKTQTIPYDKEKFIPVIKSSICTGEKVAGFKDIKTGKFRDIMLIRNDRDLKAFKEKYGINEEDMEKEY